MVCDSRVEKYMEMFSVVLTETVINGIEWILMDRAKSALLSIKFRCFVVHYNGSGWKRAQAFSVWNTKHFNLE